MTSLHKKLNDWIKEKGQVTYGEFVEYVSYEGYKISTGERELRKSKSPSIKPIMGMSRRNTEYIKGYRYIGTAADPVRYVPMPASFYPPERDYSINGISPFKENTPFPVKKDNKLF